MPGLIQWQSSVGKKQVHHHTLLHDTEFTGITTIPTELYFFSCYEPTDKGQETSFLGNLPVQSSQPAHTKESVEVFPA